MAGIGKLGMLKKDIKISLKWFKVNPMKTKNE